MRRWRSAEKGTRQPKGEDGSAAATGWPVVCGHSLVVVTDELMIYREKGK